MLNMSRRNLATRVGFLEELPSRGFVSQVTKPEQLRDFLRDQSRVVYSGIDPTADSLHVGHILPVMCLAHFQPHGRIYSEKCISIIVSKIAACPRNVLMLSGAP
ncbi:hypothetical protein EI94DRAFT_1715047 [Lactarius quietus]|nr:hypothetical protein EI94DRAFT_1715047 [Lactarius quietus]